MSKPKERGARTAADGTIVPCLPGVSRARLTLVIILSAHFALLLAMGLARHWSNLTSLNDLGIYDQAVWGTLHGKWFLNTSNTFGVEANCLGFHFNPILKDVDVFVSLAKMKCHATAGITLSMKNLFGIVPPVFYRRSDKDSYRSSFHSTEKFDKRVPRVILDLNRIRPVNLSIIDGIGTCEGGEGPWIEGIKPVRPELLVAGKDPLATDTVAAALMGFDASGPSGQQPFIHGDNHFVLAGAVGLGCNDLAKIGIIGPSIEEARFNFEPAS